MKLLDCTIRDGGYTNDWNFSNEFITELYEVCDSVGIDYMEIGFRRNTGKYWFNATDDMISSVINKKKCKIAVMAQVGTFSIDDFVKRENSPVDLVRVLIAYHEDEGVFEEAFKVIKELKDYGYEVSLNVGRADKLDDKYKKKIYEFKNHVDYLWFADTYGHFTSESAKNIVNEFESDFKVGFHAHDNLKNATEKSLNSGAYIIDGTMNGIGRGVGNAHTELMVCNKVPCFEFIYKWLNGSKLEMLSMITAEKSAHINYAIELANEDLSITECVDVLNNIRNPNRYESGVVRRCFCRSKSSKLLYKETIPNFSNSPLGTEVRVRKCNSCGFIFSDNFRKQKDYDEYYEQNVSYMKGKISSEGRYQETVDIIKKYTNTNSKIIDIGCGPGTILQLLKNEGYVNLTGVDPSCEILSVEGVRGVKGTIFDFKEESDFLILSHIMEHVFDLESAMKNLNSNKVYVEVPNMEKYPTKLPFQDFNIEHINHFSHKSLTNLFDMYGYTCIEFNEKVIDGWYPSMYCVFEKRKPWNYIEDSQRIIDTMREKVGNKGVNILGAGILGRRFISTFNVQRVFDDATHMQGKKIGEHIVEPFDETDETHLITSNFYIPNKGKIKIDIW